MLIATKTPVTEIPNRAMLDLEEIGGGGFRDAYAVLAMTTPTDTGHHLLVELDGTLVGLEVPADTLVTVVTFGVITHDMIVTSNALEA